MKLKLSALSVTCLVLTSCGQGAGTTSATQTSAASAATETTASTTSTVAMKVGDCVQTTVASVGTRLQAPDAHGTLTDIAGSGSAISYANGINQVSYDAVAGIDHARTGDTVNVCLQSLPPNCPPGDDRGKTYSATNARTHETWSAMDSEHMCGGA